MTLYVVTRYDDYYGSLVFYLLGGGFFFTQACTPSLFPTLGSYFGIHLQGRHKPRYYNGISVAFWNEVRCYQTIGSVTCREKKQRMDAGQSGSRRYFLCLS